jgi:hypothetical protein
MSQPNQSALFEKPGINTSHWAEDVCANRHKGAANSVKANPSPERKESDRKKILRLLKEHIALDIHQFEILMGKSAHCFSGRLTELKKAGLIVDGEDGKWRLKA